MQTVKFKDVGYLKIDRTKFKSNFRFDSDKYFYLATYSSQTLISSDSMRDALFHINSANVTRNKTNVDFLNLNPQKKQLTTKYFVFP